ncbi:putative glutathione S-transferase [Aspergillus steynii IBT 23096]|uniref:Putative glutathione S-transferase n=1 Tax=Aspergillus steynii IBT 23096 TaxID=1392250 RepID=A0A2I2G3P9_9EURO|nr:putative glutathione S-transferase [Aspergillus steynii IBT 23096]PLB47497.1 putative glutathione S-transferase [Aspergillus steynii IBT 23096]
MASTQIVLFDLPSKDPLVTWTPNPWKTRLVLNFKGLDYRTEWVEYPDIKPTLESHVSPDAGGTYTIPTIALPDGKYLMDSRKITDYLEEAHPQPTLRLDSLYLLKVEDLWSQYMGALRPVFIPEIPKRLLNDASIDYWYTTRERMFNMPLDRVEKELGGERGWNETTSVIQEITALLSENKGPFFEGEIVGYADFVWASVLLFLARIGPDFLDEALKRSGNAQVHLDLLEAVKPWSSKDH